MSGPALKSLCQGGNKKDKKKRELARALDLDYTVVTNFLQSAQKAVPSRSGDDEDDRYS